MIVRIRFLVVAAALGTAAPTSAAAQTDLLISGQLDLVASQSDELDTNTAFRGDSPFNPVRLRLFAQKWLTDEIGVFAEVLHDTQAGLRVNGAYAVLNSIGGQTWLNGRFGLAPSAVGSFGLRSTYFNSNPLIGVPLTWQYRTNLSGGGTSTVADFQAAANAPGPGLPLLYDSCWNIQWELLGEFGLFEYSVALTPGSFSNPVKSRLQDGHGWMARLGAVPAPGLRIGLSGGKGPYLAPPTPDALGNLPYPDDPADFDQELAVLDAEYLSGRWAIFAEATTSRWESPLIAETVEAQGGFVEVRFDFSPGWYAAGRLGALRFSDVDTGGGVMAAWDADVNRSEFAIGYRLARDVLVKVNWQRNSTVASGFTQNLFATQLSTVF